MEDVNSNFQSGETVMDRDDPAETPEARLALVKKQQEMIRAAKVHHKKAFDRMRDSMTWAKEGSSQKQFHAGKKYVANIIQRFLNNRVSKLYAKNPKAYYSKRPRREFEFWDGNRSTIEGIVARAAAGEMLTPIDGAIIQDYKNGMALSKLYDGMGDTMVKAFNYFLTEQKPKVKTQMKQLVRRTLTCGVGYIKLGYQRELQRRSVAQSQIDDITIKMQNMQRIAEEIQEGEGDIDQSHPDMETLRLQLQQITSDPSSMEVIREGMVFDFPKSTSIIVDPSCTNLQGFVGAEWIVHEIFMPANEIKEIYDIDLCGTGAAFKAYEKKSNIQDAGYQEVRSGTVNSSLDRMYACIWEMYDRKTGLVYTHCEGYHDYLDEPGTPNVEVEGFFPIYALVFNGIEDEKEIYPKSDVELMIHMQDEWNRSREGLREHRQAARPRYITPSGAIDDNDKAKLRGAVAHEIIPVNIGQNTKVTDLIQPIPSQGVDPNLYDTNHLMQDMNIVVGTQESSFGSTGGATATEVADAASTTMSTIESNIDDMDDFLTEIARDGGQIIMLNTTTDKIKEIVGPGAVWPESDMTRAKVVKELFIEIEAGSSGKANRQIEISNFERINPAMLQIPGLNLVAWLKEGIRRLDDKLDPDDFINDSLPSAVAMNSLRMPANGTPVGVPEQQGDNGAQNAPNAQEQPVGSAAPMGANANP